MSKSLLVGLVAGIGVATVGGVAAFSMLGKRSPSEQEVALVEPAAAVAEPAPIIVEPQPEARPALAVQSAAPAPAPVQRRTTPAPAPRPAPQQAPAPAPTPVVAAEPAAPAATDFIEGP